MTVFFKSVHRAIIHFISVILFPIVLMACSGGETGTGFDEASDTTITVGRITEFGSVYVNDIEFDTTDSTVSLDNISGTEDDLELGMVVAIEARLSEDGQSGVAVHIDYQDVLEAIVDKNLLHEEEDDDDTDVLEIAGQKIHIDDMTVFDSRVASVTSLDEIEKGNVVEVSGFTSGDGNILASRIEVKAEQYFAGEEIEVKGRVAALNADTFRIGALVVDYTTATLLGFPKEGITNGQYVEAMSNTGFNSANEMVVNELTLLTNGAPGQGRIPAAGNSSAGNTPIQTEGIITSVSVADQEFSLNGQTIIITDTTIFTAGASIEDITENQSAIVTGFIDAEGIITATVIRLP